MRRQRNLAGMALCYSSQAEVILRYCDNSLVQHDILASLFPQFAGYRCRPTFSPCVSLPEPITEAGQLATEYHQGIRKDFVYHPFLEYVA